MIYFLLLLPVAFLVCSVIWAVNSVKHGKKPKKAFLTQLASFCVVLLLCVAVPMITANATESDDSVQTASKEAEETSAESGSGWAFIAAALATGLSGIGGGLAVASAAPAAIGATSEDPKVFGKALIFVALGEGIALYGLLVSILIYSKI